MPINRIDASEIARWNDVLDEVTVKIFTAQHLVALHRIETPEQLIEAISGIYYSLYSIDVQKLDQIGFEKVGRLGNSEWKSLLTMTRHLRAQSPECEQQMRLIEDTLRDLLSNAVRELVKQNDPTVSNIVSETRLQVDMRQFETH